MATTKAFRVKTGLTVEGAELRPAAGTTSYPPILLTSGSNLATPTAGAFEYDGSNFYLTASTGGRKTVAFTDLAVSQATSSTLGTIKLSSDTAQTVPINTVSATASRSYGLQVNATGQGMVNVPWTDTVYTSPLTLTSLATGFSVAGGTTSKTLTVSNTLTLANATGADGITHTLPATNATIARTDAGQIFTGTNTFTSPSITTSLVTGSASFDLLNTTATTLNIGGAATTMSIGNTATAAQAVNMFTAATAGGTYNIATAAASSGTKAINIGTGGTTGSTTTIAIGTTAGTTPTIALNGAVTLGTTGLVGPATMAAFNTVSTNLSIGGAATTFNLGSTTAGTTTVQAGTTLNLNAPSVVVSGNLTVNGTTTTLNSNTLQVDDKNLELGSVISGVISVTGTIGTVSGAGPFTATITGMASTAGLIPGQTITSTAGTGNFGSGVVTVVSVASATSITISSTLTFTAGTVTNITGSAPTDASADGGGITLKGASDKTFQWSSTGSNWTSSENLSLASTKTYKIDNVNVLSATALGSAVVGSSLTSVGTIGTGTWQGTLIAGQYGGTGVNNSGKTITVSGNTTIGSGTNTVAFVTTANTSVTLPTTGTLITSADNITGSAATLTNTRTIWGQNFNGSANVTGSLTSVGSISMGPGTGQHSNSIMTTLGGETSGVGPGSVGAVIFNTATVQAAKVLVKIKTATQIQIIEMLVAVNAAGTVYMTQYGDIQSDVSLATVDATISGGDVTVTASYTGTATATAVTIHSTAI
jgi:hypothetical protein